MLILGLAAATYVFLLFLGYGLARLALPRSLILYRAWLAPWLGLSAAVVLLGWLSRLGMSVASSIYPVIIVGAALAGWSILRNRPSPPALSRRDRLKLPFAAAFLITLLLALYPLLSLSHLPTTISLFNFDSARFALGADFLKHGSLRQPPLYYSRSPLTADVLATIQERPGSFLLISLCGQLFGLPTYRVFFVLLAVIVAATTPLVGVFARVAGGNLAAVLLALTLSAFNVNQLYFFYHGFAGQVFCQGCLITAFLLLWTAENDRERRALNALMIGLVVCAMFDLYPVGAAFFLIPYGVYASFQLLSGREPKWLVIRRYSLPIAIAIGLNPFAFWHAQAAMRGVGEVAAGWTQPRWALPVDMIGLMTPAHVRGSALYGSESLAAAASIPIVGFAILGFRAWRNWRLTISVAMTVAGALLYFYAFRHFSYGYHKITTLFSFVMIGTFSIGVARILREQVAGWVQRYAITATVGLAAAGCLLAASPLIGLMEHTEWIVTPDLAELATIRPLAGARPIHILDLSDTRVWEELWAAAFLDPVMLLPEATASDAPLLEHPDELTLTNRDADPGAYEQAAELRKVLWKNGTYALLGPSAAGQPAGHP